MKIRGNVWLASRRMGLRLLLEIIKPPLLSAVQPRAVLEPWSLLPVPFYWRYLCALLIM